MTLEAYDGSNMMERRDYERRTADRRSSASDRREVAREKEPERRNGYDRRVIETRRFE